MQGGCLNIWIMKDLDFKSKWRLIQYSEILAQRTIGFSLEIKPAEFQPSSIKKKFLDLVGSLPKTSITICGFADPIFVTAEEILNLYDGWFLIGIKDSEENIQLSKGKAIKCYRRRNFSDCHSYLVNGEFMTSYINYKIPQETRDLFSIRNLLNSIN
jgi:hypothetical protein